MRKLTPAFSRGGMAFALLLALLSPLDEGGRGPGALLAVQVLLIAWIGFWLLGRVAGAVPELRWDLTCALGAAALLGAAISALRSRGPAFSSLLLLEDRGCYLLGLLLLLQVGWTRARTRLLTTVMTVAASIVALRTAGAWWLADRARPAWPFLNPNHLAAWLAAISLVGFGAAGLWEDARARATLRCASVLCACGVVLTGSRGGVLGLLAGTVTFVVPGSLRRARVLVPLLVLAGVCLGTVLLVRAAEGSDPYRYDRLYIWRAAARVWLEHPATGLGPGQLRDGTGRYLFPRPVGSGSPVRYTRRWRSAHSVYLQVLAEEGLLGALLLGATVLSFLLELARAGPRPAGLPAVARFGPIAALLVQGAVDDLARSPALVWLPLLLYAAAVVPARPRPRPATGGTMPRLALPAAGFALAYALWGGALAPYLADRAVRGSAPDRWERACRLNPLNPGYWLGKGRNEAPEHGPLGPDQYAGALRDLDQAASLAPARADVQLALGRLHLRGHLQLFHDRGSALRARRHYERAAALEPADPFVRLEAARAWRALGDPEGALRLTNEAIRVEPLFLGALLERARLLVALGRTGQAVEAMAELDAARRRMAAKPPADPRWAALARMDATAYEAVRESLGARGRVP